MVPIASISASSGASGSTPRASTRSVSMKLAYMFSTSAASVPGVEPGQSGDDVADGPLGGVAQVDEGAGGVLVRRDLDLGEPAAVDVAEEVVLRADGGINVESSHVPHTNATRRQAAGGSSRLVLFIDKVYR